MNLKMLKTALAGLVLTVSGFANAGLITTANLSGSETVEGFEDLITDTDLTTWFNGWRTPTDGYYFNSGVTFASLSPPNLNGDIIIGDTSIGNTSFGTSDGGSFSSTYLPGGTAFIADDGPGIGMRFIFDDVVNLAGMYVAGSNNITISVFDISNTLIESYSSNTMANVSTWQSNFLGISASGIKSVQFSTDSDYWIADNLTFTNTTSVPEPSTLAIFALGIMGLASRKFKKQ